MKILIVEDEPIPAAYLTKMLKAEGYEVIASVEKGAEAIHKAKEETPDIILMDIMLEDHISGCEAAVEIKKHNPNIFIVFLTAYSDQEMINFAVDSEAFGYLLKPYREKEILATLALAKVHLDKIHAETPSKHMTQTIELVEHYSYDTESKALFRYSTEVNLGPKAIQLIDLLCQHPYCTLDTENILQSIWETPKTNQALRSLVYRIREATTPDLIVNSSKTGYRIGLKKDIFS